MTATASCAHCGESWPAGLAEYPVFTTLREDTDGHTVSDVLCSRQCLERYLDDEQHLSVAASRSFDDAGGDLDA